MTDLIDAATGLEAEHLARSLARVERVIPTGVAGICDDCGEDMPRLVGGRCGFCRDGRTPPLGFYDRPAPVALPSAPQEENDVMATTHAVESRKITVEGEAARAIELRADADQITYKEAANELILAGAGATTAAVPTVEPIATTIDQFDTEELIDELRLRMSASASARDLEADLAAMTARAVAAEGRVEATKAALLG